MIANKLDIIIIFVHKNLILLEVKREVDEEGRLLPAKGPNGEDLEPEQDEEKKAQEEHDDAMELVQTIKSMTGLWDADPEDSA